ncbi:MAG: dUTP diphosphatase, partial [Gammaproteobacteria bacterium]|nr:dUTP diphosphatase [Gammaproteobacteria bacterium]
MQRRYHPLRASASGGQREVELHRARLRNMAVLQDSHNRQVHADWRDQGYEYYRAVWIECAELLDHIGWKWWRRQQRDLEQVRLEIVDIWHFGLSDLLRANAVNDALADHMVSRAVASQGADLRAAVEELALATLERKAFDIDSFLDVMNALP